LDILNLSERTLSKLKGLTVQRTPQRFTSDTLEVSGTPEKELNALQRLQSALIKAGQEDKVDITSVYRPNDMEAFMDNTLKGEKRLSSIGYAIAQLASDIKKGLL